MYRAIDKLLCVFKSVFKTYTALSILPTCNNVSKAGDLCVYWFPLYVLYVPNTTDCTLCETQDKLIRVQWHL